MSQLKNDFRCYKNSFVDSKLSFYQGQNMFMLSLTQQFIFDFYKLKISKGTIKKKAIEWSIVRGSNSGREALNFVRYMMLEEQDNFYLYKYLIGSRGLDFFLT